MVHSESTWTQSFEGSVVIVTDLPLISRLLAQSQNLLCSHSISISEVPCARLRVLALVRASASYVPSASFLTSQASAFLLLTSRRHVYYCTCKIIDLLNMGGGGGGNPTRSEVSPNLEVEFFFFFSASDFTNIIEKLHLKSES